MLYDKQNWADGPAGGTPLNAERLNKMETGLQDLSNRRFYSPRGLMRGPNSSETPTFTAGVALDAAFDEGYNTGGSGLPAVWPIDAFGDMAVSAAGWAALTSQAGAGTPATYRFMMDGSELYWYCYGGFEVNVYVDGQPLAANPLLPAGSSGYAPMGFQKLVFASAKPRLIEMRGMSGFSAIFTKKPYRIWKAAADPNPKVCVVGDSYVAPVTLKNTGTGAFTPDSYLRGLYQSMEADLGLTSLATDGVGSTGYLAGGPSNLPYTHNSRLDWLTRLSPDVIVIHGGGINDLANSFTTAQIITAATNYFKTLRTRHPKAKLVFVEGVTPPYFSPQATYLANFKTISAGVKSALAAAKVYPYFVDLTTRPPIEGTGYVGATSGNTNSNIYIGSDAAHYTELGAKYLRSVIAPKLRRVLADNGALEGQSVL